MVNPSHHVKGVGFLSNFCSFTAAFVAKDAMVWCRTGPMPRVCLGWQALHCPTRDLVRKDVLSQNGDGLRMNTQLYYCNVHIYIYVLYIYVLYIYILYIYIIYIYIIYIYTSVCTYIYKEYPFTSYFGIHQGIPGFWPAAEGFSWWCSTIVNLMCVGTFPVWMAGAAAMEIAPQNLFVWNPHWQCFACALAPCVQMETLLYQLQTVKHSWSSCSPHPSCFFFQSTRSGTKMNARNTS